MTVYLIYLAIIAGLLLIDQLSKWLVMKYMALYEPITLIPHVLGLRYTRNTGAAWSILEGKMGLFYIITIVAVGIFSYLLITEGNLTTKRLYTFSLLLMIAGSLGNFIDRLVYQSVTDFIEFLFIRFPIFNFADTFLTIGVALFALCILFGKD